MVRIGQIARACFMAGAFSFACLAAKPSLAANQCFRGWHAQAEKTAELGLRLLHSPRASDRVRLWRMIELGEDAPYGRADDDLPGTWNGTWQDARDAGELLTREAAARGVSWSLPEDGYLWSRFNLWFAAKLFEERRRLLGDQHPYLRQWLANQHAVYMKSSLDLVNVAGEYEGSVAELATDDYQYQLAALFFYAHSYTGAVDRFRAIASQPTSRYRSIAAYLAARSLVQAGRLEEALAEVSAIQGNQELADVHAIAHELVGVISWNGWRHGRSSPAQEEASRRLLLANAAAMRLPLRTLQSDSARRKQYWQAVTDLAFFLRSDGSRSWLRGKFDDDWWLASAAVDGAGSWSAAVASIAAEDELIDWLQSTEQVRVLAGGPWLNYSSTRVNSSAFRAASDHVRRRAEESGKLIWLIADAMRSPQSNALSRALYDIQTRLAACTASRGQLLALGVLRYHAARAEALRDWSYYRYVPRPEMIEKVRALEPDARREAVRLILPRAGGLRDIALPKTGAAELDWLLSTNVDALMAIQSEHGDADGQIAVVNMLPVRMLLKLAGDETLPQDLRAALIRVVWTRAYLLHDQAVLDPATELLVRLNPGLSEAVQHYRRAWTARGRKGAALMLLVRAPSMQVFIPSRRDVGFGYRYRDRYGTKPGRWSWHLSAAESAEGSIELFRADDWNHNDGNWWCRPDVMRLQEKLERDFYDRPLALAYDDGWYSYYEPQAHVAHSIVWMQRLDDRRRDFLSAHPVMKTIDWEELGRLSKIPAAPQYLTSELVAWVKDASWLDRWIYGDEMAEALALAVRATRFGCNRDGSNRAHSFAAFSLLHELFPDSEAAKHTRYWYD